MMMMNLEKQQLKKLKPKTKQIKHENKNTVPCSEACG